MALDKEEKYKNIAPTAFEVAYLRNLSNIPFAKEFYKATNKQTVDEFVHKKTSFLAPQIEARHKILNMLILQTKSTQVIELAAGISTRGLDLCRNNSQISYLHTDLPDVLNIYKDILKKMSLDAPTNLHILPVNALDSMELETATDKLNKSEPVTIVHEGLLRYLSFEEKAKLAIIVREVLSDYGGYYITTDISLKAILCKENNILKTSNAERLKEVTGISIEKNLFDNIAHAKSFFENLGFEVEQHSFTEVSEYLSSPSSLNIPRSAVYDLLKPCTVFVMKIKT